MKDQDLLKRKMRVRLTISSIHPQPRMEESQVPDFNSQPLRAAKVGHKKSRLGCKRCKLRRVKVNSFFFWQGNTNGTQCDEQKPICSSCRRHSAECVYVEIRTLSAPNESPDRSTRRRNSRLARTPKSPTLTAELFPRRLTEREDPEIPESKARRKLELRLQQNSSQHIFKSTAYETHHVDEWLQLWRDQFSLLSLSHDNVHYSQFALSATHLLRSNLEDEMLYSARQNYFVLALREQRQACASIYAGNAEAVCLTSILILYTSFAMIHERPMDPGYQPPVEWLKMGREAGAVMWKANAAVNPESPASFSLFMDFFSACIHDANTIFNA